MRHMLYSEVSLCTPPAMLTDFKPGGWTSCLEEPLQLSQAFPLKTSLPLQDTIQTFYDITHQEVKTLELKTSAKDREMELMEDNHR